MYGDVGAWGCQGVCVVEARLARELAVGLGRYARDARYLRAELIRLQGVES